jgi:sphingolipid delta-4 desaturase
MQYQGDEDFDADIPTIIEAKLFCTTFGKVVWMFLQPLFYALRPLFVHPLPPSMMEIINIIIELSFDFAVFYFLGN